MLAKRSSRLQLFSALCGILLCGGCGDAEDQFEAGLSENTCNGNFPACNTTVGCVLDNDSYTTGTFPGSGQFLVRLDVPSTVEIDFYLVDPTASGSLTQIFWNEAGCTTTFNVQVQGSDFTGTAESQSGIYSASQTLTSSGDHLIQFNSDSTTQYLVKAVITPVDCTEGGAGC